MGQQRKERRERCCHTIYIRHCNGAGSDKSGNRHGHGYPVITGGGPGIMEAGNKGAKEAKGTSVGLCINLPMEQHSNPYINVEVKFHYFFVRKVMFLKHTSAVVVMPGGFGTLDELTEAITLIQTHKLVRFPIVLVSRAYWQGMIDWITSTVLAEQNISAADLEIFKVVDTAQEAVGYITEFYNTYALKPNF